jgi:hypothetical protein
MRLSSFLFLGFSLLFIIPEISNAQIKSNVKQADTTFNRSDTITYYNYDRYDKDGNYYMSVEKPTTELRYECPICKGACVLKSRNNVPVMIQCWRCNGKGYLISNSGEKK